MSFNWDANLILTLVLGLPSFFAGIWFLAEKGPQIRGGMQTTWQWGQTNIVQLTNSFVRIATSKRTAEITLLSCSIAAILVAVVGMAGYLIAYSGLSQQLTRWILLSIATVSVLLAMYVNANWQVIYRLIFQIGLLIVSLTAVIAFLTIVDWDLWNKIVYPIASGAAGAAISFLIGHQRRKNTGSSP